MELPTILAMPVAARRGHWAVTWIPALAAYGAGELNQRYADRARAPLDGHSWSSWFAVKIVSDAVLRARTAEPVALAQFLASARGVFDGHKGVPLSFRPWDHQLRQPLYVGTARPMANPDEVLELESQEPPRPATGESNVDSLLDELGESEAEAVCAGA
jgi:ABC transporter substrate binding protein (PQQ-dependent alcohol dehydrogenase system)